MNTSYYRNILYASTPRSAGVTTDSGCCGRAGVTTEAGGGGRSGGP